MLRSSSLVIILLAALSLGNRIKVQEFPNNGYYGEEIGTSREISHYHRHIIHVDLDKLEEMVDRNPEKYFKIDLNHSTLSSLYIQYKHLMKEARDNLHKITRRQKKDLFNFHGTGIKYLTGNPDNDDLELLKTHVNALELKENEVIKKMNDEISYSQSIDTRFNRLLEKINDNTLKMSNAIKKLSLDFEGYVALHNEIINLQSVNEFLLKLVRTITLSQLNISNIELFTLEELEMLKIELIKIYSRSALLINDEHPYELIESSKSLVCVTFKTMLIILKIPIFHTNTYPTYKIYPIPNEDHVMILPPTNFYANKWYETCRGEAEYIVCMRPVRSSCEIPNVQNCTKTLITENFYRETDKAILLGIVHPIKIQDVEVTTSSLLMTDEPITIEGTLYNKKTFQELALPSVVPIKLLPHSKLLIEKLNIPETHGRIEQLQPLHLLSKLLIGLSTTSLLLILITIAFLLVIIIRKKRRISAFLFGPRSQTDFLRKPFSILRPDFPRTYPSDMLARLTVGTSRDSDYEEVRVVTRGSQGSDARKSGQRYETVREVSRGSQGSDARKSGQHYETVREVSRGSNEEK